MRKSNIILILLIILLVIGVGWIYFNKSNSQIRKLASVEVRAYNGTRLDSINYFRENSIKGVQYINISNYHLEISGLVKNPKNYTYGDIIKKQNYEKVVTLNCVEGWSTTILWKGILIKELFDDAKPLANAKVIIFHAYDGYTVTYPTDYFDNRNVLLAYEMNNVTIPPERGFPFVLVSEDKWGYKWIKWITRIDFSDDVNYRGYWESRGYSKEGNLNESFYS